jgi:hypothetical protein
MEFVAPGLRTIVCVPDVAGAEAPPSRARRTTLVFRDPARRCCPPGGRCSGVASRPRSLARTCHRAGDRGLDLIALACAVAQLGLSGPVSLERAALDEDAATKILVPGFTVHDATPSGANGATVPPRSMHANASPPVYPVQGHAARHPRLQIAARRAAIDQSLAGGWRSRRARCGPKGSRSPTQRRRAWMEV